MLSKLVPVFWYTQKQKLEQHKEMIISGEGAGKRRQNEKETDATERDNIHQGRGGHLAAQNESCFQAFAAHSNVSGRTLGRERGGCGSSR